MRRFAGEPTGDGIASEANNASTIGMDRLGQKTVDAIEGVRQGLSTAPWSNGAAQCLSQRGEASNIRKERRTGSAFRHGGALRQRFQPIARHVDRERSRFHTDLPL
jgi:hypothetical protein